MKKFIPTQRNTDGTSLRGRTKPITYNALVKLFGTHNGDGDGDKVSTEWELQHHLTADVVTIYDYKQTNLYDSDYPSIEDFRASKYEWHIGARDQKVADELIAYINENAEEDEKETENTNNIGSDFKKLTKPQMVIIIIEILVQHGVDIEPFVYNFRSYSKDDLIAYYLRLYNPEAQKI